MCEISQTNCTYVQSLTHVVTELVKFRHCDDAIGRLHQTASALSKLTAAAAVLAGGAH